MDSKENAILKAVEAFSDDMVDLTSRLVAEPSTLQNEASVNKVMGRRAGRPGLRPRTRAH